MRFGYVGSKNDNAVDKNVVLNSTYVEIFTIGGGTKFFYAFIEFVIALCVVLKRMGVPFADQVLGSGGCGLCARLHWCQRGGLGL